MFWGLYLACWFMFDRRRTLGSTNLSTDKGFKSACYCTTKLVTASSYWFISYVNAHLCMYTTLDESDGYMRGFEQSIPA